MLAKYAFAAFAFAALSAPAWCEGSGNSFRGMAYAQEMCASCHSIEEQGGTSPNPAAKPFAAMAPTTISGQDLADWLNTKHPSIPNQLVKPAQAEDMLAYIASLKAPKSH